MKKIQRAMQFAKDKYNQTRTSEEQALEHYFNSKSIGFTKPKGFYFADKFYLLDFEIKHLNICIHIAGGKLKLTGDDKRFLESSRGVKIIVLHRPFIQSLKLKYRQSQLNCQYPACLQELIDNTLSHYSHYNYNAQPF